MPSDKRNATMAKATSLIFSLIDVASAGLVPFSMLHYAQCMYHRLTFVLLCVLLLLADSVRC